MSRHIFVIRSLNHLWPCRICKQKATRFWLLPDKIIDKSCQYSGFLRRCYSRACGVYSPENRLGQRPAHNNTYNRNQQIQGGCSMKFLFFLFIIAVVVVGIVVYKKKGGSLGKGKLDIDQMRNKAADVLSEAEKKLRK